MGGAGGSQMTTVSGQPSIKYGAELGASVGNGAHFFGLYGDRFDQEIWNAGVTGKEFFGSKRLFWILIKVSVIGMSEMVNSTDSTVTWTKFLQGGLGAGLRIPVSALMSLQPYLEFNSFTPVVNIYTVGSRVNIPTAGLRLALEL